MYADAGLLCSSKTIALIALFCPGSVSLPTYWNGLGRRAGWGGCLGGPRQIWGPGECCDSAALRTLTATRQPMRVDGNADGNGDASDGNGDASDGNSDASDGNSDGNAPSNEG